MQRFWNKVDIQGPDECWPWNAGRNGRGYGQFKLNGRARSAHRVAFELHHQRSPIGTAVCHTCDVKLCCNPAHLYDGSNAQNVADAVARGLHPRGERHGRSKLTEVQVTAMRRLFEEGATLANLARQFSVSDVTAGRICRRQIWRHI